MELRGGGVGGGGGGGGGWGGVVGGSTATRVRAGVWGLSRSGL